jgi:hypothetical protein
LLVWLDEEKKGSICQISRGEGPFYTIIRIIGSSLKERLEIQYGPSYIWRYPG